MKPNPTWNIIKYISCTQYVDKHYDNPNGLNNWNMSDCICELILSLTAILLLIPLGLLVRRQIKDKHLQKPNWKISAKFQLFIWMILLDVFIILKFGLDTGPVTWLWYIIPLFLRFCLFVVSFLIIYFFFEKA